MSRKILLLLNFKKYPQMSFIKDKLVNEGLTFDDVLLVPAYSEVLPRNVDISTRFTRNIKLNAPIVSAAMDTVTEAELAIAIAREGGIGVIHKNMSIEKQAAEVRKVKRAENGMIYDPITLHFSGSVGDALGLMKENKIGGIPVVDDSNTLVGIVTNRDLRFQEDLKRPVHEVMTSDNIITTMSTEIETATELLKKNKIEKLPVVDKDNKLVGLLTFKDITKIKDNPNACKDSKGRLRVAAGVGVTGDSLVRIKALVDAGVDAIVIDTAHGHSKGVIDLLKLVKKSYPSLDVVIGNIATGDAARMLVDAGADAVKVGIGPGSICTTRVIAGVGVPQLEAVWDVYNAIKGTGVPIIADGGIRYSGDIVKALRGMGSLDAMQQGSKDRYFQDVEDDIKKLVPEGIVARVPFKGNLAEVLYQMIGGLRAGMGYCGAPTIVALKNAKFIRITSSGMNESHPHDVQITSEAPNYSR